MQPIQLVPKLTLFPVVRAWEEALVRTALQKNGPVLVVAPSGDLPALHKWAEALAVPVTRVRRQAEVHKFYVERAHPGEPHLFLVDANAYDQLFYIYVADAIHLFPQPALNKPGYERLHQDLDCKHHPLDPFPPIQADGAEWYRALSSIEEHLGATCSTRQYCAECQGKAAIPVAWWRDNLLHGLQARRAAREWLGQWVEWSGRLDTPGAVTNLLRGSTLEELYVALRPGVAIPAFRYILHEICLPSRLVHEEEGHYRLTLFGEVVARAPGNWPEVVMSGGEGVPTDLIRSEADQRYLSYRLWATVLAVAGIDAIPEELAIDLGDTIDNVRPLDATVNPQLRDFLQAGADASLPARSGPLGLLNLELPGQVGLAGRYLRPFPVAGELYAEFLLQALPACPAIGLGLACRPEALLARHSGMQREVDRLVSDPRNLATALRMLDTWDDTGTAYARVRERWLKAWLDKEGAHWFRRSSASQLLDHSQQDWAGPAGSDLWLALENAIARALAYQVTAGTANIATNVQLLREELLAAKAAGRRAILVILDGLGWTTWRKLGIQLPPGAQLRDRAALVGIPTTTRARMPEIAELVAPDYPESFWTLFRAPLAEEEDAAAIMARFGVLHTVRHYQDLLGRLSTLPAGSSTITVYVSVGDRVCTGEGIAPEAVYAELIQSLVRVLAPRLSDSVIIITSDHGLTPTIHDPLLVAKIKEDWGLAGLESNRVVLKVPGDQWTEANVERLGLPVRWNDIMFVSFPSGYRRDSLPGLAYTHGGFSVGESFVPVTVVWREDR